MSTINSSSTLEAQLKLNPGRIRKEMQAQVWLEAHDTGSTSTASGPR